MELAEIDKTRRANLVEIVENSSNIADADIVAFLARAAHSTLYQICRSPRKPIESEVISAAAKFFAVFFLKESLKLFDPRLVLIACVNLAAKTEEYHSVSLTDITSSFSLDKAELKTRIPVVEMKLLAALDYDLVVEQPWPIMLYWVEQLRIGQVEETNAHLKIYDIACGIVHVWQWTDAVLVFSFPQIATAAVWKATQSYAKSHTSAAPDEQISNNVITTMMGILRDTIGEIDVDELVLSIEQVVNRFGAFERTIKDPTIEATIGFRELTEAIDYTNNIC